MRPKAILIATAIVLFITTCGRAEEFPFSGRINAEGINIRADATVSAEVISILKKTEAVEVIAEAYGWYKIRLPKETAAYVNKYMSDCLSDAQNACHNAKIIKEGVNIRLGPSEASAIIGKINRDEAIIILGEKGDWYKIVPPKNSFGWVHKNFITKYAPEKEEPPKKEEAPSLPEAKPKEKKKRFLFWKR